MLDFSNMIPYLILTYLSVMTVFHSIIFILFIILQYRLNHTLDHSGQTLTGIQSYINPNSDNSDQAIHILIHNTNFDSLRDKKS